MEEYNKNWTEQDFEEMGWHDCRLYSINFLKEEFAIELNIDYIFNWNLNEDQEVDSEFIVAPCLLKFKDYNELEINIPWGQTYDIIIKDIRRGESVPAPNGKVNLTEYEIILETGYVKLQAPEFSMNLLAQPVLLKTQDIDFDMRKKLIEGLDSII